MKNTVLNKKVGRNIIYLTLSIHVQKIRFDIKLIIELYYT